MDYFIDYYAILDIDSSSTISEIKASFRNKLKLLHPDLQSDIQSSFIKDAVAHSQNNELLQLIQAYNVLSSPIKRKRYDRHVLKAPSYVQRKKREFNYEEFLNERQHIFSYRVKLFMYDLVHKSGKRAIMIYENILFEKKKLLLKSELGRFDYIDCLALMTEYYQERAAYGDIDKCIVLYREIFQLEQRIYYFKDYMNVLIEQIQSLLEKHMLLYSKESIQQKDALHDLFACVLNWEITPSAVKKMKELQIFYR